VQFLGKHWLGFAGSVVVLVFFLALPACLLFKNITDSGSSRPLPNPTNLGSPRANYIGKPVELYASPDSYYCVAFEFFSMNEATSYVHLVILMWATSQGLGIIPRNPGQKTGLLIFSSNAGLSDFSISFHLESLIRKPLNCSLMLDRADLDMDAAVRLTQNIYTLGSPRSFPNDWYELDDTVAVMVAGKERPLSLIMTSRNEGFTLTASMYEPNDSTFPDRLMFVIHRPPLIVLYTYWIALMPAALLIGIFSIIWCRKRKVRDGELPDRWVPRATDVAFGVAATMVAILPLRMVLVPSSLPGLTRLDILFGIEIAFLVAASLIWIGSTSRWESAGEAKNGRPSAGQGDANSPSSSQPADHA
jgi:hypothetical protein